MITHRCACCDFDAALEAQAITYYSDLVAWWLKHHEQEVNELARRYQLEEATP